MFGWLTTPASLRCRHAPVTVLSRRMRQISPHRFVQTLPSLGSVLYLHSTSAGATTETEPAGLLVSDRSLAPLLDVCWLMATSVVTAEGPREWIECLDRFGQPCARLHLLPDSDYLAWEALVTTHDASLLSFLSSAPLLRPDNASVMNFCLRKIAGLSVLEGRTPMGLSQLGRDVAAHIAQAEALCALP